MKKYFLTTLLICLCGCTAAGANIQARLDERIENAKAVSVGTPSYHKDYYSYYIEPSVGRLNGTSTGNLFSFNGVRFVMNLNTSDILNDDYGEGFAANIEKGAQIIAEKNGDYTDYAGETHHYRVLICDVGGESMTYMHTDYADFYSVSSIGEAADTAREMLVIARTLQVNENAILSAYSSHEQLTTEGSTMQLFDSIVPENGMIDELFAGHASDSEGQTIREGTDFVEVVPNANNEIPQDTETPQPEENSSDKTEADEEQTEEQSEEQEENSENS